MPRVIHFEITADDPERATTFYTEAFGWTIHKWDGPQEYWLATTGTGPGIDGAVMRREANMPPVVNTIDVESIDDSLAKIAAAGGTVVMPKTAIPGVGTFAYCHDTEGNMFGVMQSEPSTT